MQESFNRVIEFEIQIQKEGFSESLLANETFLVWYLLTEGIVCDYFSEKELKQILRRNFLTIINQFKDSHKLFFVLGWGLNISFWLFGDDLEKKGSRLLYEAYRKAPENLLYKWAIRDHLNLTPADIQKIERSLTSDLGKFIDEPLIERYFYGIIKRI